MIEPMSEPYGTRLARLLGEAEAMGMTPDSFIDWLTSDTTFRDLCDQGSLNAAMQEPEHGQQPEEAQPNPYPRKNDKRRAIEGW